MATPADLDDFAAGFALPKDHHPAFHIKGILPCPQKKAGG
jgi:hypothetical protein